MSISSIITLEQFGVISMTRKEITETPEQLFERIKPAFDAVDLDDLSVEVRKTIYMTEISGTRASDDFKRLVTLLEDEVITDDETRVLIMFLINKRYAA